LCLNISEFKKNYGVSLCILSCFILNIPYSLSLSTVIWSDIGKDDWKCETWKCGTI